MLLTPEQQKTMLGFQSWSCDKCKKQVYKNYCRDCDEFFYQCDCTPTSENDTTQCHEDHRGHRTY